MGNYLTFPRDQPPWDYVEGPNDVTYDRWGFRPVGMTYPTQLAFDTGMNYPGAQINPDWKFSPTGNKQQPIGFADHLLSAWGPREASLELSQPKAVVKAQDTKAKWTEDKTVCTPDTYPHCNMTSMRDAAPIYEMWDNKQYDVMDEWAITVERALERGYQQGGFDFLNDVNQEDTSLYDPCDNPTLLEVLLPLGLAMTGALTYNNYISPVLTDAGFPAFLNSASLLSSFLFGINLGRAELETLREPSQFYVNAANAFYVPICCIGGWYMGSKAFEATSIQLTEPQFQAGFAGGLFWVTSGPRETLAGVLELGGFGAGFVLAIFNTIIGGVSYLWCRLTTSTFDACQDKQAHSTGRRWDVSSIAGKLTDEVREVEGWARDDPRAEFVFRGLTIGPEMMRIVEETPGKTVYHQPTTTNPIGELYQGNWWAIMGEDSDYDKPFWYLDGRTYGWDGADATLKNIGSSNLYACQNWDVLRNGKQSNPSKTSGDVPAVFDQWIGNWEKETQGTLSDKAHDPANLRSQQFILGWQTKALGIDGCPAPIQNVLANSITMEERWVNAQAVLDLQVTKDTCTEAQIRWLEANVQWYTWANGVKPGSLGWYDIWVQMERFTKALSPEERSAYIYAVTAMRNNKLPAAWAWLFQPMAHEMWQAMINFPPPNGTPYTTYDEPPIFKPPPITPIVPQFTEFVNYVLNAPDLEERSRRAEAVKGRIVGSGDKGLQLFDWFYDNQTVYYNLLRGWDLKRFSEQLNALFPKPERRSDALWAVRAEPINAEQKPLFDQMWADAELYPNLTPEFPKPPEFPGEFVESPDPGLETPVTSLKPGSVSAPVQLGPGSVAMPIGLDPGSVAAPVKLGPGSVADPVQLGPGSVAAPVGLGPPMMPILSTPLGPPMMPILSTPVIPPWAVRYQQAAATVLQQPNFDDRYKLAGASKGYIGDMQLWFDANATFYERVVLSGSDITRIAAIMWGDNGMFPGVTAAERNAILYAIRALPTNTTFRPWFDKFWASGLTLPELTPTGALPEYYPPTNVQ